MPYFSRPSHHNITEKFVVSNNFSVKKKKYLQVGYEPGEGCLQPDLKKIFSGMPEGFSADSKTFTLENLDMDPLF